jgi:hypothetical protein
MRAPRLLVPIPVLCLATGLAGCGLLAIPGADTATDATRLPETDRGLTTTEVAADHVTFTYAAPPTSQLAPGQVIVGQAGGGYLRKVVSAQVTGNTIVVMTAPAVITDAIANEHLAQTIDPATLPGPHVAGDLTLFDLTGRVLVDTTVKGVPVKVTVVRGTAQLHPTIDFALDITKGKLDRVAATMTGTLTLALDLKLDVGGAATFQDEIDLSGPTGVLYSYPFVFPLPTPLGPLPVAGTIELDAFAGFAGTITAAGSLTAGLAGTAAIAVRAAWEKGAWTVDNQPTFTGAAHRPQLQTLLATNVRAYVRPELRLKLYGVVGPRAQLTPALKAQITAAPPAAPTISLAGCISGQVGFDARLFGVDLVDLTHDFPEACQPLALP